MRDQLSRQNPHRPSLETTLCVLYGERVQEKGTRMRGVLHLFLFFSCVRVPEYPDDLEG